MSPEAVSSEEALSTTIISCGIVGGIVAARASRHAFVYDH
jgi:hypothetical protein